MLKLCSQRHLFAYFRYMKKFLLLLLVSSSLSSCYILRAYNNRHFKLEDLDRMDADTLYQSSRPFYFRQGSLDSDNKAWLDSNLANTDTYAFLVIRNDSILYEKMFVDSAAIMPSFSVAKSFVSTLTQIAVQEGKIKSLQQPITEYLPWLQEQDERFSQITIQHLLDMRSGIRSSEDYYKPASDVLKLGFTKNIRGKLRSLEIEKAPGTNEYKSVNTQLLAMVVEAATGQHIQDYLQEKIWEPLGMESYATWNIDSRRHRQARAFCCINAKARDYAKLGRLYLNKGNWNGQQLLDGAWVTNTTSGDTMFAYDGYKNQWWTGNNTRYFSDSAEAAKLAAGKHCKQLPSIISRRDGKPRYPVLCTGNASFMAKGILGQYIFVNPANNTIVVRLGHNWKHPQINAERFLHKASAIGE